LRIDDTTCDMFACELMMGTLPYLVPTRNI